MHMFCPSYNASWPYPVVHPPTNKSRVIEEMEVTIRN